jgi:BioD-like phosphotransacetylase family protein
MARILVAGSEIGAGATTVAVGLASAVANAGQQVRVERLVGDERATEDAEVFGELELGAGSGDPMTVEQVDDVSGVLILEAPAGADAGALASQLGARLVFVRLAGSESEPPSGAMVIETHAAYAVTGALPEDRALAAPRVAELIAASGAEVLTRSEAGERAVCDHLVVGAISHDPADDYFARFPRKAVVTRNGRVDLALAAMLTGTECLILSGGGAPSPYILDRAAANRETTLLMTSGTTVETMHDIEGCFGTSPFSGDSKVARVGELMASALDTDVVSGLFEAV